MSHEYNTVVAEIMSHEITNRSVSEIMSHEATDIAVAKSSYYTNLHLSAVATLYPPTPRHIKRTCEAKSSQKDPGDQKKLIRVYYTEPSYYGYNPSCYLIKETRFGVPQEWYAASDELVADDAAPGSPVAAIGWWADSEDGLGFKGTWEVSSLALSIANNRKLWCTND